MSAPAVQVGVPVRQRLGRSAVVFSTENSTFWMVSYRVLSAIPGPIFAYLVARTTSVGTASAIFVAIATASVFQLLDFGLVTASSNDLTGAGAQESLSYVVSKLLRPQSILLTTTAFIFVIARALQLAAATTRIITFICVVSAASSVSVLGSVFERTLVMRRSYRSLSCCAIPMCIATGVFLGLNFCFAVSPSNTTIAVLLFLTITVPRISAFFVVRFASRTFSSQGIPTSRAPSQPQGHKAAKGFLALQVIALISFQTDVVVAKFIGDDSSAVRLALLLRAFGPVLLIGSTLAQDIWPRLHAGGIDIREAKKLCIRVLWATIFVGLACASLTAVLNVGLPAESRLRIPDILAALLWFPMLSFGNAIGQVLAARNNIILLVRRGWLMAFANLGLSMLFGYILGPPGYLLGSFVSYSFMMVLPSWRLTNSG